MFNNNRKTAPTAAGTTIIAGGVVVRGDVHFCGNLHLEGRVEGTVSAEADNSGLFTLSDKGSVAGEVNVPQAVIDGAVEGDIRCAGRLELAANARIQGDVHYMVLEMAAGAQINGRLLHDDGAPRQLPHLEAVDADVAAADQHVASA